MQRARRGSMPASRLTGGLLLFQAVAAHEIIPYEFVKEKLTYTEAHRNCRRKGGSLAWNARPRDRRVPTCPRRFARAGRGGFDGPRLRCCRSDAAAAGWIFSSSARRGRRADPSEDGDAAASPELRRSARSRRRARRRLARRYPRQAYQEAVQRDSREARAASRPDARSASLDGIVWATRPRSASLDTKAPRRLRCPTRRCEAVWVDPTRGTEKRTAQQLQQAATMARHLCLVNFAPERGCAVVSRACGPSSKNRPPWGARDDAPDCAARLSSLCEYAPARHPHARLLARNASWVLGRRRPVDGPRSRGSPAGGLAAAPARAGEAAPARAGEAPARTERSAPRLRAAGVDEIARGPASETGTAASRRLPAAAQRRLEGACEAGWTEAYGQCYQLVGQHADMAQCLELCACAGASLACPSDFDANREVAALLPPDAMGWIGAAKLVRSVLTGSSDWSCAADDKTEALSFANWAVDPQTRRKAPPTDAECAALEADGTWVGGACWGDDHRSGPRKCVCQRGSRAPRGNRDRRAAATRVRGLSASPRPVRGTSTSRPRRRRDSSRRTIHVAATTSPRPVRGTSTSRPRRRRDLSAENLFAETSTRRPAAHRRDGLSAPFPPRPPVCRAQVQDGLVVQLDVRRASHREPLALALGRVRLSQKLALLRGLRGVHVQGGRRRRRLRRLRGRR